MSKWDITFTKAIVTLPRKDEILEVDNTEEIKEKNNDIIDENIYIEDWVIELLVAVISWTPKIDPFFEENVPYYNFLYDSINKNKAKTPLQKSKGWIPISGTPSKYSFTNRK